MLLPRLLTLAAATPTLRAPIPMATALAAPALAALAGLAGSYDAFLLGKHTKGYGTSSQDSSISPPPSPLSQTSLA